MTAKKFRVPFFRDRFITAVVIAAAVVVSLMAALRLAMRPSPVPGRGSAAGRRFSREDSGRIPSGPLRVRKVIDGDTLVLEDGQTVRLLGIDAPETHHPELPAQRFGGEAAQFLRRLAEGLDCTLEYEPPRFRDDYGRLLAYVFVEGRLVNAEMVRRGYAYAYTRFPFQYQKMFLALEKGARSNQYGLWNFSLRDGRITNLIRQYESLSLEGRMKLDEFFQELLRQYPLGEQE